MDFKSYIAEAISKVTNINKEEIESYFPSTFTPQQMQETVIRLLKHWKLNRDRDAR